MQELSSKIALHIDRFNLKCNEFLGNL